MDYTPDPVAEPPAQAARTWIAIPCLLVAVVGALIPFVGMRGLGAPLWLSLSAASLVFPVLPLVWHAAAERARIIEDLRPGGSIVRLSMRSLAVALLVAGVSLANLGPSRLRHDLLALLPKNIGAPAPQKTPGEEGTARARSDHPLESFIPPGASLVVALSGSAVMQQLLAAHGVDTQQKLAAFEKCQIQMTRALILIAARDRKTHLVVVRAPGITEQRNLYCLVGVLGDERLKLRFEGEKALRFEVQGLLPRNLIFTVADAETVVAADEGWRNALDGKAPPKSQADAKPPATAEAPRPDPLRQVLGRIDRTAVLWAAGVAQSRGGPWDLAVEAHFKGTHFKLRGSSVPPSGQGDRAEWELRVPLTFAAALPEGALNGAIRGAVSAVLAARSALPAPAETSGRTP